MPEYPPLESRRLAQRLCVDCAWYHGAWPLWRGLGLGASPFTHEAFYQQRVDALGPRPRVLVSAAADAAMAMLVHRIRPEAHLVVVDRCETPLALARQWAEAVGRPIVTTRADLRDYDGGPFDLIVTHAVLGYFDPTERAVLARRWHALLAAGGAVVTVNRLRPGHSAWRGFDAAQQDDFVAQVSARAGELGLPAEEVRAAAGAYAARMGAWPIASVRELQALFEGGGFEADVRTARTDPGGPAGPSMPSSATYALVTLRHRPRR